MVNVLHCELSLWRGDGELCRWCNADEPRAGRRFCSRECTAAYANNHQYLRGRAIVLAWNRGCSCDAVIPKSRFDDVRLRREVWDDQPPHVVCVACGECEAEILERGDKITVNHIIPRNGIPTTQVDCVHHLENLEPLCWRDHEVLNQIDNQRDRLERELRRRSVIR